MSLKSKRNIHRLSPPSRRLGRNFGAQLDPTCVQKWGWLTTSWTIFLSFSWALDAEDLKMFLEHQATRFQNLEDMFLAIKPTNAEKE